MVLQSQNDTELWRLVSQGDGIAFKLLFDAWWEKLYVYAWNRLRSEADAQDVVQEVMINPPYPRGRSIHPGNCPAVSAG